MNKHLLIFNIITAWLLAECQAQISPPGMGKAQAAGWFALGLRQDLDTIEDHGWQSMSYIGMGRKSNPDNNYPLHKPAIWVFNQEFYNQFDKHWQSSIALSYRIQDEYQDMSPYEKESPAYKQEYRLYGRLSYILENDRFKFVPTFRQEIRKFYTPNFKQPEEELQFRSRFRLQLTMNLDNKKIHRIIASSEQLFSISKENEPQIWTNFSYKESRFMLYYALSPKAVPFTFSLGYMNNLVGWENSYDAHYIAFDIVFKNPF